MIAIGVEVNVVRKLLATGLALSLPLTALGGCAGARVESGAAIGAATGAALGGGVGVLITDEDLLGSPASDSTGDTSIPTDGGILASVAIGAVVGAIVGAMVGHRRDEGFDDIVLPQDKVIDPSLLPEGSEEIEAAQSMEPTQPHSQPGIRAERRAPNPHVGL